MRTNYDWEYDLYDLNKKHLGRIGSNKHLSAKEHFIVTGNSYEVIRSFYNKYTDYNSDLIVIKTGSVTITEPLCPMEI